MTVAAAPARSGAHSGLGALPGWCADDAAAALVAWSRTSGTLPDGDAHDFFRTAFRPRAPIPASFTAYYEPEIAAAPTPDTVHRFPIHRLPDWPRDRAMPSRAEIETSDVLAGHEIAWLADPVDRAVLMVQGSGRLRMPDGTVRRVGYAGANGHPYRSLGADMVAHGHLAPGTVTLPAIRDWLARHPDEATALLRLNPSWVFFRTLDLAPDLGPIGTAGVPLTPLRSIAVDPAHIPLGAPVWVEVDGPDPIRALMVAQDTGGAIRGPGRVDLFLGTGAAAGDRAGHLVATGRLIVLDPA